MKTKKALKKLDKVESILSLIIDQYDTEGEPQLREALAAAKDSVTHVKQSVNHHKGESKIIKKSPAKAASASRSSSASQIRRKVSAPAAGQKSAAAG